MAISQIRIVYPTEGAASQSTSPAKRQIKLTTLPHRQFRGQSRRLGLSKGSEKRPLIAR
jgi:hypothetical protein